MSRPIRFIIAALGVALAVSACAAAGGPAGGPWVPGHPSLNSVPSIPAAPRRDTMVVFWQEELQGMPGVHIFARNDRALPMRITKVSVYVCENIQGGCIEWDPEIILEPGDRRRLYTIIPAAMNRTYRFQWQAFTANVQTRQ